MRLTLFLLAILLSLAEVTSSSPLGSKTDESGRLLRARQGGRVPWWWWWWWTPPAEEEDNCLTDDDCGFGNYCSEAICRAHGDCASNMDCRNPSNSYSVIECTGPLTCDDRGKCGRTCGPPCEDGDQAYCLESPCSTAARVCSTTDISSCVDDFCDGTCNAIVFDPAGNFEECEEIAAGPPPAPLSCANDGECPEESYCADGVCLATGRCGDLKDCSNPSNLYPVIACIGPITCDDGQCARTCSNSNCPADSPPVVDCLVAPCDDLVACDEYVSCVDDYCGGCNAVAFNAAGEQVCQEPQEPPSSNVCSSDEDCPVEGSYCASDGDCLDVGFCADIEDCANPSNFPYPVALCVGALACDEGRCQKQCFSSCDSDEDCALFDGFSCANDRVCSDAGFAGSCCIPPSSATATCENDTDCPSDVSYCADGVCLDAGRCGDLKDCSNPSNNYPIIECIGPITCEEGQCGRECTGSECQEGVPLVECVVAPCDAVNCDEYVSCVDDYCGGCNAIAFNAAGEQACQEPQEPPSNNVCASNSDCPPGGFYCADGVCLETGRCGDLKDCSNPSNLYPVIACIGPITCDDGQCARTCSSTSTSCPGDTDPVECLVAPCSVLDCEEDIACVDNYCGGCNAIAFNAAGEQVCQEPQEPPSSNACSNDSDCPPDGSYCADGVCLDAGRCEDFKDCVNPSNLYASIACIGPISCDDGQCARTCSSSNCPGGAEPVNCVAAPCSVLDCDEDVSCIDDYCGGCNAIAFNAAGEQVCQEPSGPAPSDCTDSSQCGSEQYCAGGECLANGQCSKEVDCSNPNNIYPSITCIGPISCDDGQCARTCSSSNCPGGTEPVNCVAEPCSVVSCVESYEYCLNDYCGACTAILLDAAGNEVACTAP